VLQAQPTHGERLFTRTGADAVTIDDVIYVDLESNYNLAIKRHGHTTGGGAHAVAALDHSWLLCSAFPTVYYTAPPG
jgi:hypothetical protein